MCSPLTTPEEAAAFLAAMRDKSNEREIPHNPPSHLSADGIDAWYRKQKQQERELEQLRRKEAEALLRGYRSPPDTIGYRSGNKNRRASVSSYAYAGGMSPSPRSLVGAESLDDPLAFKQEPEEVDTPQVVSRQELEQKNGLKLDRLRMTDGEVAEEKKLDDQQAAISEARNNARNSNVEETIWRSFISFEPGAKFRPEANRYHLYVSYACPGSHRALIVRALKGLEDVVSVTYVHPTWKLTKAEVPTDRHRGWVFGNPDGEPFSNTIGRGGPFPPAYSGNEPDPNFNAFSIREIYERAGDTSAKYTIPMLWDTHLNTIVNNDSSDITYMLNSCFNHVAENPELDLYTEYDSEGMDKLNEVSEWLSPLMIHGVYRCGFAKTQLAYDKAIAELCEAFDRADEILQSQRYLTGGTLTDADIRLFVTLIRFDEVYAFYFKANPRLVMLTPSLMNFCREIYQIPGISKTCNSKCDFGCFSSAKDFDGINFFSSFEYIPTYNMSSGAN